MINIYTSRRKNRAKFRLAISEDVPAFNSCPHLLTFNGFFFFVRLQSNFFCKSKQIYALLAREVCGPCLPTVFAVFFFSFFRRTNKNCFAQVVKPVAVVKNKLDNVAEGILYAFYASLSGRVGFCENFYWKLEFLSRSMQINRTIFERRLASLQWQKRKKISKPPKILRKINIRQP